MKAILVIDIPEKCFDCPMHDWDTQTYGPKIICQLIEDSPRINFGDSRPSWCPLKPLPEKEIENGEAEWNCYAQGWNACLKEITE